MIPDSGPVVLLAAVAVVAAGYVIFGITGFGASLITVPVLSHFWPVPLVLALATVLDLSCAMLLGLRQRRRAAIGELRWLVPFSLLGAVAGVTLLVNLPRAGMLFALGAFVLCYGIYGLAAGPPARRIARGWAPVAGAAGGVTGTLFGVGGPPYLIYLARRLDDKDTLRGTMATMVFFSLGIRVVVFAAAGVLLQPQLAGALVLLAPAAVAGLWLGNRFHLAASHGTLLRILHGVLLACGASLVVRAGALAA